MNEYTSHIWKAAPHMYYIVQEWHDGVFYNLLAQGPYRYKWLARLHKWWEGA